MCEGAPSDIIPSLVKAEKLLVGYGPGLEIKFDTDSFDSASSMIQNVQDAGGRVSLFGFDIRSDAKGSNTVPFDDLETNSRASTISIPAISDTFPVLVGVLARRL